MLAKKCLGPKDDFKWTEYNIVVILTMAFLNAQAIYTSSSPAGHCFWLYSGHFDILTHYRNCKTSESADVFCHVWKLFSVSLFRQTGGDRQHAED